MKNFVLTFLVGALVVFGGFGVAWADSLSCKRTTSSSLAFTSSAAFDSWFPKRLNLDAAGFQSILGKKSMVLRIGERKYQLLPNGKLIAELAEQTGYKSVGAIRYKCNKNSIQVAQSNKVEISKPSKVAEKIEARPSLGVMIHEVTADIAEALALAEIRGALVSDVNKNSPAFFAGVERGDVILKFDGQDINRYHDLISILAETDIGSRVNVELFRLGKNITLTVQVGLNGKVENTTKVISTSSNDTNKKSNILMAELDAQPNKLLSNFDEYRRVTFRIEDENQTTMTAFKTYKVGTKYLTKGLTIISSEVCETDASFDTENRRSEFRVQCPSGYSANGKYKPLGAGNGSVGDGKDSFNNLVQYRLHPNHGKYAVTKEAVVDFFLKQTQENQIDTITNNQQQTIYSDTQIPLITITSASSIGPSGTIEGRVTDNAGVGEVRVDGQLIQIDNNGNFTANTYVPEGGVSVIVEAVDVAGLSSSMSVRLDRVVTQSAAFSFDRLNPIKRKASSNPDALALIIGVADYKETNASAVYADSDAKVFTDYAVEKLGVPRGRIKTLVNDGADEKDVLLAVKRWLSRGASAGKTDIYVFFAGHGLASDDGKQMYLLPYDGAPELLEKTAILREELFNDIASANPRSVTVFLDTCYSGTTRGSDVLIASRPIALKALKQSLPDNFTVLTAAAGDQTAKPLEEAKHGMFSYFLMKGMEGDADANQDNQITAGELHAYVQSNVVQQSSGSQTPELQGDADRVLVQFQ